MECYRIIRTIYGLSKDHAVGLFERVDRGY